jgi:hypothetical protein
MWLKAALFNVDHSKCFTNACLESYHNVLKNLHLKGRKRLVGRRLDWMMVKLMGDIEQNYW